MSKPRLIIDNKFSDFFAVGALTTIIKSYSAFGPSLSVIRLVSSLVTGFSMYQDSYLISLLITDSENLSFDLSDSYNLKGSSGLLKRSFMFDLEYLWFTESTESSTICSLFVRFVTLRFEPSILPG